MASTAVINLAGANRVNELEKTNEEIIFGTVRLSSQISELKTEMAVLLSERERAMKELTQLRDLNVKQKTEIERAVKEISDIKLKYAQIEEDMTLTPPLGEEKWVKTTSNANLPVGAVVGGHDIGINLYIIRAQHQGHVLPGKLPAPLPACVPFRGAEILKMEYEVLVGLKPKWVAISKGDPIPKFAVRGGSTTNGEPLYIGRAAYDGIPGTSSLTNGYVTPNGECHVAYYGEKVFYENFEILIRQ